MTVDEIKDSMRSKEVIMHNQKCEIHGLGAMASSVVAMSVAGGDREYGGTNNKPLEQSTRAKTSNYRGSRYVKQNTNQDKSDHFISSCRFCSGVLKVDAQLITNVVSCKQFNHFTRSVMCKTSSVHIVPKDTEDLSDSDRN